MILRGARLLKHAVHAPRDLSETEPVRFRVASYLDARPFRITHV